MNPHFGEAGAREGGTVRNLLSLDAPWLIPLSAGLPAAVLAWSVPRSALVLLQSRAPEPAAYARKAPSRLSATSALAIGAARPDSAFASVAVLEQNKAA